MKPPTDSTTRTGASPRTDLLFVLGLLALAIVFFLPVFRGGTTAVIGGSYADILTGNVPLRSFVNGELLAGRIPLWWPNIYSGHPIHAEGEGGIFYPLSLLLAFLPIALSINLSAFVHILVAGIAFYGYLRLLGLRPFVCFLGGAVYMFSSGNIGILFAGHVMNYQFIGLLPLLLALWEGYRRYHSPALLIAGALAYGAFILAGSPQYLFYSSIFLASLMLLHLIGCFYDGQQKDGIRTITCFCCALLAGVFVGAVQLLPTFDFVSYSFRAETSYEFGASFSFPPENLFTFLVPTFFGDMADRSYWGRNYLWEVWGFLGTIPLVLAILACIRLRSRAVYTHLALIPALVLLALGGHTSLFWYLYHYVPGFDLFRGSSKFINYAVLSLCVLGSFGMERLLHPPSEADGRIDRRILLFVLSGVVGISLFVFFVFGIQPGGEGSSWRRLLEWRFAQGETYVLPFSANDLPDAVSSWKTAAQALARTAAVAVLGAILVLLWPRFSRRRAWPELLLLILILPEIWLFSRPYLEPTPLDTRALSAEITRELKQGMGRTYTDGVDSGVLAYAGEEVLLGYTGMIIGRYNNFLTAASGLDPSFPMSIGRAPFGPGLLKANVDQLILRNRPAIAQALAQPRARAGDLAVYDVTNPTPRAYFSEAYLGVPSREAAYARAAATTHPWLEVDIVESSGALASTTGPLDAGDALQFRSKSPRHIVLDVSLTQPRLLVLADAIDPHWRCYLDGTTALEILPVNLAFRGVEVPTGKHEIHFRYQPTPFYFGAVISLVSLGLLLLAALYLLYAHLRKARTSAE